MDMLGHFPDDAQASDAAADGSAGSADRDRSTTVQDIGEILGTAAPPPSGRAERLHVAGQRRRGPADGRPGVVSVPNQSSEIGEAIDPFASTAPPHIDDGRSGDAGFDYLPPDSIDELTAESEMDLESSKTRVHAAPRAQAPRLLVIGGHDRGQEFMLRPGDNSIGRGLDNDIVLADIAVSRRHTVVSQQGADYVMRDLGSGNGTLVNGTRLRTHLLRNGDQIELGNTLMRFVASERPAMALAEADTMSAAPLAPVDEVTDPETSLSSDSALLFHGPKTQKRRDGLGRPGKFLLFSGVAAVLVLGTSLVLKVFVLPNKPTPFAEKKTSTIERAAAHFDLGRKYFSARDWERARRQYLRVYALAPDYDEAKRYAAKAAQEIKARDALRRAEEALRAKDYRGARAELATIPSSSVYAENVPELKQRVDDQQVTGLVEAAKQLKEKNDREGALSAVKQALGIAPANPALVALQDELMQQPKAVTASRPRTAPSAAERVARRHAHARMRRASSASASRSRRGMPAADGPVVRRALSAYSRGEWDVAIEMLISHAKSLPPSSRASIDRMAAGISKVANALERARQIQPTNPGAAVAHYETALEYDKTAGNGQYRRKIVDPLKQALSAHAASQLSAGRYAEAYQAVKTAGRYGSLDARLTSVMNTLEKKAMDLFTQGYTVHKSDPKRANKLWQRVLRIVPSESPAYQKAYSWLNSAAVGYQDEDEL